MKTKIPIFITAAALILFLSACSNIANKVKNVLPGSENKTVSTGEVVTIPEETENACMAFLVGHEDEIELASEIGGGFVRPHAGPFAWDFIEPEQGEFNFRQTDRYIEKAQESNIAILGTVWSYAEWDQQSCHQASQCEVTREDQFYPMGLGSENHGIPKSRCAVCDTENYKNFITELVERYDGDGVDDMEGLKIPVKYWEILNEPELQEGFLTFFKGTPEEYVEILKSSNEAVKAACPDCKIVQGGAAGVMREQLVYWQEILDAGGADYFDIANIHFIEFGDQETLNVKDFKAFLQKNNIEKPIWVTEAEYASEKGVEESVRGALKAGAEKIFFTRFEAGNKGAPKPGEYSEIYKKVPQICEEISS